MGINLNVQGGWKFYFASYRQDQNGCLSSVSKVDSVNDMTFKQ